jgi:hypothetical protein
MQNMKALISWRRSELEQLERTRRRTYRATSRAHPAKYQALQEKNGAVEQGALKQKFGI